MVGDGGKTKKLRQKIANRQHAGLSPVLLPPSRLVVAI